MFDGQPTCCPKMCYFVDALGKECGAAESPAPGRQEEEAFEDDSGCSVRRVLGAGAGGILAIGALM